MENVEEVETEDDKASLLPSNQSASHESQHDSTSAHSVENHNDNTDERDPSIEVEEAGVTDKASNQLISKESQNKSLHNNTVRYDSTTITNDNEDDERTTLRSDSFKMEIVKSKGNNVEISYEMVVEDELESLSLNYAKSKTPRSFYNKIEILSNFFQIFAIIYTFHNLQFSGLSATVFGWMSVDSDWIDSVVYHEFVLYVKFTIYMLIPPLLIFMLFINKGPKQVKLLTMVRFRYNKARIAFFLISLLYLPISQEILFTIKHKADTIAPSESKTLVGFCWFFFVLYTIGLPVFLGICLVISQRDEILEKTQKAYSLMIQLEYYYPKDSTLDANPNTLSDIQQLYDTWKRLYRRYFVVLYLHQPYKEFVWFWKMVDYGLKLLLLMLLVFVDTEEQRNAQLATAFSVLVAVTIATAVIRPYQDRDENLMEILSKACSMVQFLAGIIMTYTNAVGLEWFGAILSFLTFLVTCFYGGYKIFGHRDTIRVMGKLLTLVRHSARLVAVLVLWTGYIITLIVIQSLTVDDLRCSHTSLDIYLLMTILVEMAYWIQLAVDLVKKRKPQLVKNFFGMSLYRGNDFAENPFFILDQLFIAVSVYGAVVTFGLQECENPPPLLIKLCRDLVYLASLRIFVGYSIYFALILKRKWRERR